MLRKVVSFGFKHAPRPVEGPGFVVIDIRSLFRNPYHDRSLRPLTGLDQAVADDVQLTPDFTAKYNFVKQQATAPGVEIAYIGCTGGRHRSVAIVEQLAKDLGVEREHRDLNHAD